MKKSHFEKIVDTANKNKGQIQTWKKSTFEIKLKVQ